MSIPIYKEKLMSYLEYNLSNPAPSQESAWPIAKEALRDLATGPNSRANLETAFGNGLDSQKAAALAADWGAGDFSGLPEMLVAIDPRVEDYHKLVAGIRQGAKVVVLDPKKDGIEQITRALSDYPARSLHIVCHGAPGILHLGKHSLNEDNIHSYASLLQEWAVADILLYACEVADQNLELLNSLHQLTRSNIAASANKVGNAAQGGSWHLEY